MNADNMSDEQKRQLYAAAAKCNFSCLLILTTAAVCCGMSATSWCAFADRNIVLAPNTNLTSACDDAGFSSSQQCLTFFENHAVGFWSWQAVIPQNQLVCLSYTQPIVGKGYVTIPTDTKFNTAGVSAGIATFFGLLCFFTLVFASCCPLNPARMAGMSCYYFIATFFQGLSFLIFRSNACQKGFFAPFYSGTGLENAIETVTCSLGRGGKLAVSATVLYFFCMCSVPAARPPEPVGGNPFAREAPAEDGAAASEP